VTVVEGPGGTEPITTTYDNLVQITYPSGRQVRYEYDAQGRLARVYDVGSGVNYATDFTYHGSGALIGYTAGNGTTVSTTLDPMRYRVEHIQSGALDLSYHYDQAGNVYYISDQREGSPNPPLMYQVFQYDVLDRLTRATTGPDFYGDIPYAYDAHGNRQTAPETGAAVFTYHSGKPFHLQSINGVGNYQYDDNGNLTNGTGSGGFTYTYRPDNMMGTSVANGQTTHYAYDAEAARVKKAVVGNATGYFGRGPDGRLLTEWTNASPTATARDYIYVGSKVIGQVTKAGLPPK
jgi:YD repeat-containing protein